MKIPPLPTGPARAAQRVTALRAVLPEHVTIGVSGDPAAATGLRAGCEGWCSALAGVLPHTCTWIAEAALTGDHDQAAALSAQLDPFWGLFTRLGSYRVISAIAVNTGLLTQESLHRPVLPLTGQDRAALRAALGTSETATDPRPALLLLTAPSSPAWMTTPCSPPPGWSAAPPPRRPRPPAAVTRADRTGGWGSGYCEHRSRQDGTLQR